MVIHIDRGLTERVSNPAHALRQGAHDQVLGLLMLAVAMVLLLMPMATQAGPKDAQVNEMVVGLVVAFTAGLRIYRGGGPRSDALVGAAGVWLVISPFVLDMQNTAVHTADRLLALVAGSVLVVLSLVSLLIWRLDRKRLARPRTVLDEQVADLIARTLEMRPENATHWSTRSMAKKTGLSHAGVAGCGLQPHRTETSKLSTNPFFIDKVHDVMGPYLDPPERALVTRLFILLS
ncbi:hypothetical protein J7E93_18670 [Streptomyces sp. ISL-36]|uniref:SPW repeat domain-containing protein n=1 Tax=Streptomyces sp. ISL-36 TaxID=2819182 RepID=UPI001BE574D8|nr:hypothetical protein [Streptomyces sp. ISL-36]MBT2442091.1 hypothetical protein [Streptomyces sp. ISL-36]